MKSVVLVGLSCLLLISCSRSSNLQTDDVLLDGSVNSVGDGPTNIADIIGAPKEDPFRLKDLEKLEELIESQQISRATSREAVYTGTEKVSLLGGPFEGALITGETVEAGSSVHIFWPPDVVNDHIKIKNSAGGESWMPFRDSKSEPQVVLLEDFIIPIVSIKDSKLIVIEEDASPAQDSDVIAVATEEEKEIVVEPEADDEPTPQPGEVVNHNFNLNPTSDETEDVLEPTVQEEVVEVEDKNTATTVEDSDEVEFSVGTVDAPEVQEEEAVETTQGSDQAVKTSLRPQARPVRVAAETEETAVEVAGEKEEATDEVIVEKTEETVEPAPPEVVEQPVEDTVAEDATVEPTEVVSEFSDSFANATDTAPVTSLRPVMRPDDLATAPLSAAAGLNSEELLVSLGIKPSQIHSNESRYLRTATTKVSEVFSHNHTKSFSACTFDPAQGPRESRCYRELVLSKEFTEFLGDEGLRCANEAAQLVYGKTPSKVLLRTNGGSLNRGAPRPGLTKSLHLVGRALDVFKVFLYFGNDKSPEEVVFHKNATDGSSSAERRNYNFYWSFAGCWKKEIAAFKRRKNCGAKGAGNLTYKSNSDHHDHMHISQPVCEGVRRKFNLFSSYNV